MAKSSSSPTAAGPGGLMWTGGEDYAHNKKTRETRFPRMGILIYIYIIYTTYDIILQYSHVLGNEGRKIRYVERLDLTGMLRRVRNVTLPLMAVSDLHPQRLPSSN